MRFANALIFLSTAIVLNIRAADAEWRKYVGIHYSGFENYSFCECGSHASKCWWLESIDEAKADLESFERNLRLDKEKQPESPNELSKLPSEAIYFVNTLQLYVEAEGFLSEPGEYGHMGGRERQLWIRKIIEIREATDDDIQTCR